MSIATLLHRHAFGLKGDVRDNFCYLDEQTVIFPVGHNTVVFNLEQKTQRFLSGTEKTEEITAIAVSPSKKFVAVAERSERGVITVFDLHTLKRRRLLTTTETSTREFVCVAFSPDSKFLMAQGGAPDWTLVIWAWEKAKFLAATKTATVANSVLYQCSFAPNDNNLICVTGNQVFKLLRLTDSTLKMLPNPLMKREVQNYLTHNWLNDDRVAVGTDTGDIMIIDGAELKSVLSKGASDSNCVESLVPFSKGFVAGSEDGVISIYEKTEDRELYKKSRTFRIENNPFKLRHMSCSPTEEALVCALENNQLFSFALINADIMKAEDTNFEHLCQSFHTGHITGMDTCIRKPLIATCGLDKSVRIWNCLEKSLELLKSFNEECHSIAFHPSGLHLLVGFSDKMRLMNVLMDDIRPYKEFAIKACRECRFSNGGQYFAAVNGNTVNIFATYTCELIGNLRGHNGKVRSLSWSADDSKIVSCGMDGAVYEWTLKDFKRVHESVLKSCNYTSAACTPDGKFTFACGSDKKLKEISESTINKDFDAGVVLTQVLLSHSGRMLFAGTETGSIRSYKFPLTGDFQEYQCHSKGVMRLAMTYDDTLLFAAGEDGVLFMLDVRDKEVRVAKREKETLPYAEEILVTKSDLEEKTAMMNDLKQKVEELTLQNEYQLRLKDLTHQEKVKEMTEKFAQENDAEKMRTEMLMQEKTDMEMEYEEKIKQIEERAAANLATTENQFQQKIMAEVERYQQLVEEKELLNERWDEQNSLLVESHERLVQELTDEYEYKLQEEQLALQRIKEEKEDLLKELEETRRQVEDDADREIEELKEKYEARLATEREQSLRLKGENGIMRKKFSSLQKDIEDRAEEIKALFAKEQDLYQQIKMLEKEIAGLKKEIRERDETIGDKEKRIYDLKKKNQELEKFKFVLDYKIKELKKQIEPREQEIGNMKEQIKEMDQELERYRKSSSKLELVISDMTLKLDGQQKEILSQRRKCSDGEARIKRFRTDLHEVIQHIQDPKALKESVKKLYQKHVTDTVKAAEVDLDIQKEYNRQRDYLEKTVDSLKRKLGKDMELHRTDNMRIMQENVALIKEINDLRREIKTLKQGSGAASNYPGSVPASAGMSAEAMREIEMQREEIRRLRDRIEYLESTSVMNRPTSRERLPPMEGFAEAHDLDAVPGSAGSHRVHTAGSVKTTSGGGSSKPQSRG